MKHFEMTILALLSVILLMSGCLTCEEISRKNRWREADKRNENFQVAKFQAGKELRSDFEVVFRNPDYLSSSNTPERAALSDMFAFGGDEVPSAGQIARLLDAVKNNPQLVDPLNAVWLSDKVTVTQRMDFAVVADRNAWELSNDALSRLLTRRRFSDEDCAALLKRVRGDGPIATNLLNTLESRRNFKKRMGDDARKLQQEQAEEQRRKLELERKNVEEKREQKTRDERWESERREQNQVKENNRVRLVRSICGNPKEFREFLDQSAQVSTRGFPPLHGLSTIIWKHGSCLPATNLLAIIAHVIAVGRRTGDYPVHWCDYLPVRIDLSYGEFRSLCLPYFIEMLENDQLKLRNGGRGEIYHDRDIHLLLFLFGSKFMEDEEVVLAYAEPWASALLEEEFSTGGAYSSSVSDEDCRRRVVVSNKIKEYRREAFAKKTSTKEYQARIVELVKQWGPERLSYFWFTRFARERGGDYMRRMEPYMEMPVEAALKMAREKLRAKQALRQEEEKSYMEQREVAESLYASHDIFSQKVLPRLADATLRKLLLTSIRWNSRTVPVENLRAIVDWELASNPDRHLDLYSLMRRPELTAEMLRHYYPRLVACCTRKDACHGVRGILDNVNVSKELLDLAYLEPRLSELRFEYFRRQYGTRVMSVDDIMTIECALGPLKVVDESIKMNRITYNLRPLDIKGEQDLLNLDSILKQYLPAKRPNDWDWRISMPEFDYFANDKS